MSKTGKEGLQFVQAQIVIQPIYDGPAQVVHGSRFLGNHPFTSKSHYLGNRLLTLIRSLLYGSRSTEMEICSKAFNNSVISRLSLKADRFDTEPEITARILKPVYQIQEAPISYQVQGFEAGKKIPSRDSWHTVLCLFTYRWFLRTTMHNGKAILSDLPKQQA